MILSFFLKPRLSDCARALNEHRCLNDRERIKARAREMREAMGLPEAEALR